MIGELQGRIVSHCVLKRAMGLNYILLRLVIKFGPKAFFRHTQRTSTLLIYPPSWDNIIPKADRGQLRSEIVQLTCNKPGDKNLSATWNPTLTLLPDQIYVGFFINYIMFCAKLVSKSNFVDILFPCNSWNDLLVYVPLAVLIIYKL